MVRPRLIALGGFLFRHRSYTPILWFSFLLVCSFRESQDLIAWLPGLILMAVGEGLRIWAVAVIGKESRTRGGGVARFVMHGPYAYVRNPLYVGNFFILLGVTFVSELLWLVPVAAALFAVQYVPIVLWEESVLSERFGADYAAYSRQVPRWFPRWRRHPAGAYTGSYQWRAALKSERSTFGTLALLLLLMIMKENMRHLPKYFHKHFQSPVPSNRSAP